MNKYIIKNCPCYCEKLLSHDFSTNTSDVADKGVCMGSISNSDYHCQYINNCVMKQIVELCRENLNSLETYVDVRSFECVALQNILKLLDIQEVE